MAISQVDFASTIAEISKLSDQELKDLCNSDSDAKIDEIVGQSDKIKGLEAEREMIMASVRSLAEFNLSRRTEYEADKSKLLNLFSDNNQIKDDIQDKANKLLEISKRTSLESTLAVVLAATAQAEEESESIAKSFLKKDIDFDPFVNQYCEKRKLAHLRRIKADKLRQETNESWSGITNSQGITYDFGGSRYIAVDNFTFGKPTKFTRLDPSKARSNWDEAIQVSSRKFQDKVHNIVYQNCHSHVADALNEMKYEGRTDWNQLDVWWLITAYSKYIGFKGFLKQWGPFLLIFIIVISLVYLIIPSSSA